MGYLIETHNLSVSYQGIQALKDINIQLPKNQKIAIIGPNGAGKSTFIKACLGLVPFQGTVTILNRSLKEARRQISYVPQRANVNWHFPTTVEDVIKMGISSQHSIFSRLSKQEYEKVQYAIETMQLADIKKRQINQLSGGQKQRVFLARAIAQDAQAYFLDEPLAGIDQVSEKIIIQQLEDFKRNKQSSMTVHHQLDTLTDYFDYLVMINQKLIISGPIQEVLTTENLDLTFKNK